METKTDIKLGPTRRKSTTNCVKVCAKEERNASLKKVSIILQKPENERTIEEQQTLDEYSEIVADLKLRWHRRDEAKRRTEEVEEPPEVLQEKCLMLARAIANSEHLVIYTGAGISTAARIPDYRGTNGIWTRLQQGKDIGNHDLSLAEPTFTHMSLYELYSRKILKYLVSQNCDGLHLRSGLPRSALSELHGNMYIEVCKYCKPVREYWRLFDVTENTARFSHKTMRRCYVCSKELVDTIVHFGERGTLQWPLNWKGACMNADKADTILCLGSSLKVLKRYPWLWQMNKPVKKRPNLFIVNLQWTPKDESAVLKINGKCDYVMKMVMKYLGIEVPAYDRDKDPIFAHATLLLESEMHTTNQPHLKTDKVNEMSSNNRDIKNDDTIKESRSEEEVKENGMKNELENVIKNVSEDGIKNDRLNNKLENRIKSELENNIKIDDMILENDIKKKEFNDEIKLVNGIKDEEMRLVNGIKDELEMECNDGMEYEDDDNSVNIAINNSDTLYYEEEQIEAIDYSKNKNDKLVSNVINCDINTRTSIKTSRLSINNGSSSSTMSEQTSRKIYPNNTPSVISNNSIFSVDSILHRNIINKNDNSTNITSENDTNNYQKLMAYYELANTVLQNQMLSYFTSNFYPYQTSFLYPGLHSIINPIPFINYDFNCTETPQLNQSTSTNIIQVVPTCSFCKKTFDSNTCLFYSAIEPKFLNELYRFSKKDNCNKLLVCVCCDYTTDEDDEDESDSGENKKIKTENDTNDTESVCENNELKNKNKEDGNNKICKIQAGWFGKGCRKNRRIKKR